MKQQLHEGRKLFHKLRYILRAGKQVLQEYIKVEVHRKGEVFYIWEWYDVAKAYKI